MKEKRKVYEEKFEAQLKEWNAQILLLKAKAVNAKADAKIEYLKTVEKLQHKHDEAGTKLHKLKTAGDLAWEDIKTGSEKVWNDARATFLNATSKFK